MWSLLPVILTLLSTAASRTQPIDRNEMFIPPESLSQSRNFADLRDLTAHLKQIEMDNLMEQHQESNKNEDKYDLNARKIIAMDTMDGNVFDDFDDPQIDEPTEVELNQLTNYLSTLLKQPVWVTPFAVVDEPLDDFEDNVEGELGNRKIFKRSRYYRRYPWKRQNGRTRNSFDDEPQYLCIPSRQDVYNLLRAIHDVRQGNKSRTVNYCNRQRPVNTILTNIRFLGRRK